jgi:hypothetical protein
MLIISKFKDYYDGIVGTYGIDKTIVYNRELDEIDNDKIYRVFRDLFSVRKFYSINFFNLKKDSDYDEITSFVIGFCGKLYIGWKLYLKTNVVDITYDKNLIVNNLNLSKKDKIDFDNVYNQIINFDPIDIHREYYTPIFIHDKSYYYNKKQFVINPILSEYKFYKVIDPVTTFQEIQMYISGVLGSNEKNIIEIDDKYKIPQHGFDNWSFKTRPHKKKK